MVEMCEIAYFLITSPFKPSTASCTTVIHSLFSSEKVTLKITHRRPIIKRRVKDLGKKDVFSRLSNYPRGWKVMRKGFSSFVAKKPDLSWEEALTEHAEADSRNTASMV